MNKRLELTRGRIIALFIGVPLCLAVIGFAAVAEVADAGQASYPVRLTLPVRGDSVTIGIDSGTLDVVPAVGDHLRVRGRAQYALVRSSVSWQATSAGVTVDSHCHFWMCTFDYQVAVPEGIREVLSAGKGDITGSGLTNLVVSASSGSGDITLTFAKVPARITIRDAFGNVRLVLPRGRTAYEVSTQAPLGTISVTVPTSPSSVHVISVDDSSGNIWITQ